MKTVYFVRHAKSSWKIPALMDHDRPLNKRGAYDAPRMGELLAEKGVQPDVIFSSTAVRALRTAHHFAEKLGFPTEKVQEFSSLFHASGSEICQHLSLLSENTKVAMLFGHNPGTTSAIAQASELNLHNVPTCGVAAIEWPDHLSWKEIATTKGKSVFYTFPKEHFYDSNGNPR